MNNALRYLLFLIIPLCFSCWKKSGSDDTESKKDTVAVAVKPAVKALPDSVGIIGNNVNIRVEPKVESPAFKQLHKGMKVKLLEKGATENVKGTTDTWYKIRYKTKEGWVFGAFTSLKADSAKKK